MRRLIPLAIVAAGAALILAAAVVGALTARYVARAESAPGVVVGVVSRPSGGARSEVALFPVVEYRPADGRPRRFRGEGSDARDYRVGDRVEVLHLPDPPRDPRITGAAAVWSRTAALLFAGVLVLLCGLLARAMVADRRSEEPGLGEDPELDEP